MLYARDRVSLEKVPALVRATVLCRALEEDLAGSEQDWGKLWEGNDIGILGRILVDLGPDAIPSLSLLLDNNDLRSRYHGDVESAYMSRLHYRVKDFAAYYVSEIHSYKLKFELDLERRDRLIQKMRKRLKI